MAGVHGQTYLLAHHKNLLSQGLAPEAVKTDNLLAKGADGNAKTIGAGRLRDVLMSLELDHKHSSMLTLKVDV